MTIRSKVIILVILTLIIVAFWQIFLFGIELTLTLLGILLIGWIVFHDKRHG